ncbi:sulfur carrier protein ThiS [Beggiatoa alba]|nr:sulfur carrier protein ThiS [Beggiatoa alba]
MKITVNGDQQVVNASCTAAQLVELMGIASGRIAMEVNQEIVPRSTYESHQFQANDVVEIVHAVGGG